MQSDEAIDWQPYQQLPCLSCGAMANFMRYGLMYRSQCDACGNKDFGRLFPAHDAAMPRAGPFEVHLDCSAVEASARNMLLLSKLHKALRGLKPAQLKALVLSDKPHLLGLLTLEELETLRQASANSSFVVVAREADAWPDGQTSA